jgi:hypothetical protein
VVRVGFLLIAVLCLAGLAGPITGDMNLRLIAVVGYGMVFPATGSLYIDGVDGSLLGWEIGRRRARALPRPWTTRAAKSSESGKKICQATPSTAVSDMWRRAAMDAPLLADPSAGASYDRWPSRLGSWVD